MVNSSRLSHLATVGALILLEGCSGGITSPMSNAAAVGQQGNGSFALSDRQSYASSYGAASLQLLGSSAASAHAFVDTAAISEATHTIAVSDVVNNVVDVYNPNGKQVAQLTGFDGPQGMASDIKGDLYVTDPNNSQVQVFAAGFKSPATKLMVPGQYPAGVDSFANGTFVAVTSLKTTSGGAGSVSIFQRSRLIHTVTSPNLIQADACAFDATGNLYVSGLDGSGFPSVGEIRSVTTGGTSYQELTMKNKITYPGGIQVTTDGHIAVDDQSFGTGSIVYTYNSPKSGSLGSPVRTTALTGSSNVVNFAFSKSMNDLYAADAGARMGIEYAYPAGGTPILTIKISSGVPVGIAVIPTQFPSLGK